jgi:hypothetical protein
MPTVTSFTRIKSDKAEEMVKIAKEAKKIVEKHGAEFLRVSRFHTGPWIGDWLVVVRYPGSTWQGAGGNGEGPGLGEVARGDSEKWPDHGP